MAAYQRIIYISATGTAVQLVPVSTVTPSTTIVASQIIVQSLVGNSSNIALGLGSSTTTPWASPASFMAVLTPSAAPLSMNPAIGLDMEQFYINGSANQGVSIGWFN